MRLLVFQHVTVEHPGVFRDLWREANWDWTTVEVETGAPIPDLAPYDLLAVMGGPMDVWEEDRHPWLIAEKQAIRTFVRDLGRPYLGLCLGHQLLADALGGRVAPMAAPEVGFVEVVRTPDGRRDPLLADEPNQFITFQWHGSEVTALPEGAVRLAGNAACPIQALRWGRWAYGFQYHVEITPTTVPDWQAIPAYAASLTAALGPAGADGLAAEVAPHLPAFRERAGRMHQALAAMLAAARA